jgi:hypothetical protein
VAAVIRWAARLAPLLLAGALGLVPGQPIRAQAARPATDSARRDSLPKDSVAADSVRRGSTRYKGHHAIQGVLYALVIAPAGILSFIETPARAEPSRLGFWKDHVSLYFTAGDVASSSDSVASLATRVGTASVEVLKRGFLAEARFEYFEVPAPLRYATLRFGRLSHPIPSVAGGVTLGYRHVRGPRPHDGLEIGFPFIAGGPGGWVRMEAAYVVSLRQSSWNYRLQWERLLGRGPFFVGANLDLKAWEIRRRGELSHGVVGILVGTTNRRW